MFNQTPAEASQEQSENLFLQRKTLLSLFVIDLLSKASKPTILSEAITKVT